MRILHYYSKDDPMVSQYVKVLTENMGLEAENHTANEADQAKTLLKGGHYDVLHLHGCWRNSSRSVVALAFRQGARLVLTPHGQLQPWVQDENRWKDKLPKRLLYQRDIVRKAYAVVIQGRMEQECMEHLGWNHRMVTIRNCIVTHSITPQEMASQTFMLYRRVMDSNQWELMTDDMHEALKTILNAGITGDLRWVVHDGANTSAHSPIKPTKDEWRKLLCYACQEQISDTVYRGICVLGLDAPDIDAEKIDCFMPDGYAKGDTIDHAIGFQFATENDRLLATFRHIKKLVMGKRLSIMHLVELNRELRQHDCEEEYLGDTLRERRLWKLACRMMVLMREWTGLTEGFMPVPPLEDRTTREMMRQIEERLKV